MIRFALHCDQSHEFESWFRSGEDFDRLRGAGQVACPVCGSRQVDKALMTPAVAPPRRVETPISQPASEIEARLAELKRHVEANSEYVGLDFVTEARRIHAGETPERAIHGEARIDEARALIEEGVPVAPLPFVPARKAH